VDAVDELQLGREAYANGAWLDAYEALSRADAAVPLEAADVELLATSAALAVSATPTSRCSSGSTGFGSMRVSSSRLRRPPSCSA